MVTHDESLARVAGASCPRRREGRRVKQSVRTLAQATRMIARDWRLGELKVLAAALVVAVASLSSVAFLAIAWRAPSRATRTSSSVPTWSCSRPSLEKGLCRAAEFREPAGRQGMSFMSMAIAARKRSSPRKA